MKDLEGHMKGEKHRGGGHKGRRHHHGAQTFRRGRALEFLERLNVKRITLTQQLEAPEFQEIKQVILGELKAIELIIDEFTKHFDIHEVEDMNTKENQSENE
ncbi:hypothetical protein [Metabacillus sediminilitoris]|uniref:2-keto-3-deoxygluconate kinase n=1 Tax=Metabacillus sediminilitoris TaxID=2567941 RepID=A0A4S4C6Y5_9BACI|nr:hypothetical protein [Metabacillus sediminilitoris]QGQ48111.1 hypothetical protein GMB29_24340 [Metabacillus sediminilitoris]THF81526.1 hypothetical protein E6W99_06365 [Metabacillus sediminilitoris]